MVGGIVHNQDNGLVIRNREYQLLDEAAEINRILFCRRHGDDFTRAPIVGAKEMMPFGRTGGEDVVSSTKKSSISPAWAFFLAPLAIPEQILWLPYPVSYPNHAWDGGGRSPYPAADCAACCDAFGSGTLPANESVTAAHPKR